MISYKNKYKKYKQKYLLLKNGIKNEEDNYKNKNEYETKKFIKQKYRFNLNEELECKNNKKNYGIEYQTNPKFKKFDHIFFHAGDYDDFRKYGLDIIYKNFDKFNRNEIDLSKNIYKNFNIKISDLYNQINFEAIKNNFSYYFDKLKKCIFVAIKDNKLLVFLPFSNANYSNDFMEYLYFDNNDRENLQELNLLNNKKNKNKDDYDRIKVLKDLTFNRVNKFNKENRNRVLHDRSKWVANNCLFRNNYPEYEGEKLIAEYEWLLSNLLKNRKIPDIMFFLNVRDHLYLKDDLTEPYNFIYESDNKKIDKKYIFDSYLPLLSSCSKKSYSDLPIPTTDDIQRISGILFASTCNKSYSNDESNNMVTDWNVKKNKAIFMGTATGCGTDIENNMRLKAASISQSYPDELLVGITDWNWRLKKSKNGPLKLLNLKEISFKLSKPISRKEISEYKYILYIDGHVSAWRLSFDLSYNSVPLIVKSDYYLWFSKLLKPYEHYVPIESDLSDLIKQIRWCKSNDKKCQEIAKNAKIFYDKYLSKEGIFDYMQSLFVKLSSRFTSNFISN